ncbi:MAG: GAF domain-containing protein [Bacteroidales bacterium]|jgi:putative methionine-R-sulfoxide reductase with GAF domain/HAMP domain-containing protein|nr:GAF domain-containing protein [Bacteroidales bacterium]
MNKLNDLKIRHKIVFFVVLLILSSSFVIYISFNNNRNLTDISNNQIKNILDSTERVKIKSLTQVVAHDLSKQILEDTVKTDSSVYAIFNKKLSDLRHGRDREGYFYVYKKVTCIFTANKIYEGKDLKDDKEYQIAKSGGGFFYDNIFKEGKGDVRTLLYSQMIPGTDYWMGTVTYLDTFGKIQDGAIHELNVQSDRSLRSIIIIFGLVLLITSFSVISIARSIITPIKKMVNITSELSTGKLQVFEYKKNDEIKPIFTAINGVMTALQNIVNFSVDIKNGKFNSEYTVISEHDRLGQSLIEMRDSLKIAKEKEDNRKDEENVRIWTMNGHSNVADILRKYQNNVNELSDNLLQDIIHYSDFNQGGIFLLDEDDDSKLNLLASYAYDRKKFTEKTIEVGVGLVGTCAIEKKTIYMTDVPNNYINITSGLGGANPRSLIICPMINDDKLVGVIEFASFNEMEDHKREFIERCAENIAATIITVRNTMQTEKLLEISKVQSEHLASQEEELRQNIEEMSVTNEANFKKQADLSNEVEQLKNKLIELGVNPDDI